MPPAELRRTRRPPVRVVHLGLGAFHRAHQAWYSDADDGWGIAAFTGRSPRAARELAAQDGVYTLLERGADGDRAALVQSVVEAHDGADAAAWRSAVANPQVAVLTLTVTEAGYHATPTGGLDRDDPVVVADVASLVRGGPAHSAPGRLVDGLRSRREAGGGPIAVVSCDNLAGNGRVTRAVVGELAGAVDPALADWVDTHVAFVATMVDRITPATTDADRRAAHELGFDDAVPVVAEPFSEWALAGAFPAGRPAWERAGARFVDDVEPYENRKLWLLNGAHSLLAYRGLAAGHETVAQAFADASIAAEVEALWAEARAVLPLPDAEIDEAVASLRERFANPRIRHTLAQIAVDGSFKLPLRVAEPMRRRLAAGLGPGQAQVGVLAAWALHLERVGPTDEASRALVGPVRAERVLDALAPDLASAAVDALAARIAELRTTDPGRP